MLTADEVLSLADRIEVAYKREHAQWHGETNAAKEERNRIACKMRYEFSAKCRACKSAPGNVAAMREALEEARKFLLTNKHGYFESMLLPKIDAALAAPARNADRFATIDEARLEFQKIRGHKVWADIELWDDMDEVGAFVRWLFAPAEGDAE